MCVLVVYWTFLVCSVCMRVFVPLTLWPSSVVDSIALSWQRRSGVVTGGPEEEKLAEVILKPRKEGDWNPLSLITWCQTEEQRKGIRDNEKLISEFWKPASYFIRLLGTRGYKLYNLISLKSFKLASFWRELSVSAKKLSERQGWRTRIFPDWRMSTLGGVIMTFYALWLRLSLLVFCLSCLNECACKGRPPAAGLFSHYQSCLGFIFIHITRPAILRDQTADCHELTSST